MRVTIVEGTPEEISQALPNLIPGGPVLAMTPVAPLASQQGSSSLSVPTPDAPSNERRSGDEATYVSTSLARKCLTRLTLSREQLAMLRAIYNAHPNMLLATELAHQIGYSTAQFAGLMGAFGRRISYTEGYEAENGSSFFEQEWSSASGCNRYRLPETVREAIRLEGLV